MDIHRMVKPQDKLQSLFIEMLKDAGVAPMKVSLMQYIKETLAEAFEVGFHSANTGIKGASFRFLETVLVKTGH